MKILTILGTRPEIIRLSRVIPRLDEAVGRENHFLVNTGQNRDANLNSDFFVELGIRVPDIQLDMHGSFAEQVSRLFPRLETILETRRPDRVLILGDTNTALSAIVAVRAGIPVYHMEAGNRSFSPRSPEEVNRRLVDHSSTVLLPYTERSRQNLLAEGIHSSRIFVTGNPIWEVIQHYAVQWQQSDVLARLGVEAGKFFLVTLHREENVDDEGRLRKFLYALHELWIKYGFPVVVSTHPRTRQKIVDLNRKPETHPAISLHVPFSFFDFLQLQSQAFCVLSDSGTVQEECCILHRPMVCLRDYTERPECLEVGASALSGVDPVRILALVEQAVAVPPDWTVPADYLRTNVRSNVAETVVRILTSHFERGVA